MTEEDEEDFKINIICRFCEKITESDKVGDHCHLTGEKEEPAHNKGKTNVIHDQSNFIPVMFHNFSSYDCLIYFKKLVDQKKDKVKFKIIPQTIEENISISYSCIGFIDFYRFLSSSLDSLVETLVDNNHAVLKGLEGEIVDNDETLNIVKEIKRLIKEHMYNIDSSKDI